MLPGELVIAFCAWSEKHTKMTIPCCCLGGLSSVTLWRNARWFQAWPYQSFCDVCLLLVIKHYITPAAEFPLLALVQTLFISHFGRISYIRVIINNLPSAIFYIGLTGPYVGLGGSFVGIIIMQMRLRGIWFFSPFLSSSIVADIHSCVPAVHLQYPALY